MSEALLYRHFPTKAALYDAIQQLGCQVDPALAELNALAPSTATLTEMVQAMFQHVVFGAFDDPGTSKIRQRLILQSLLEDGEYARLLLSRVARPMPADLRGQHRRGAPGRRSRRDRAWIR